MNTHGYITDTPVYDKFWTFSNPHFQRYIALTQGHVPTMHEDFTYVEVGCGNAFSLCVNAAANPNAKFIGLDFMPEYIDEGWKYVDMLGLKNVELMKADVTKVFGVPEADFVFTHGFLSWVAPDVRTALYEFIGSTLKPGGIAFTSYDSMPGSAHRQTIHHIAQSYRESFPDATDRIKATYNFLNFLHQHKSHFVFHNNAMVKDLASGLNRPEITAHQFANEWYRPLWFADVNKEMNTQGLVFCGTTTASNNNPSLVVPQSALEAVTFPDTESLEFVKDMFANMEFRSDLYIRPLQTPSVAGEFLSKMRFTLTSPRELAVIANNVRVGRVELQEDAAGAILDNLVYGDILSNLDADVFHNLVGISMAISPQVNNALSDVPNRAFVDYQLENYTGGFITVVSGLLGSGAILPVESVLLHIYGSHGAAKKWLHAHPDVPISQDKLADAVSSRKTYGQLIDKLVPDLLTQC